MDRFIRSQNDGHSNSRVHISKGQATSRAEEDAVNAKTPEQTAWTTRTTEEKTITSWWKERPIGIEVVLLALIFVAFILAVVYTAPVKITESFAPHRIHLQTAPLHELELLPNIGPKMAERIVQYRKTTQLRNAEDLLGVFGIGQRTVDLLRWVVAEEAIE